MAMDVVKRTIEILAKGTVKSATEPFTNVSRLKEDAVKIRDEVAKGYGSVKDTYQSMRSGGGLLKKVTDWFYQRGDQFGSDFEDDDFDSGFDSGFAGGEEESHGKILDADAMKDIAKSQVGAMYRIGGKQVEASMMNTAEIITSVNARTTEITAAVNNLNKSIIDIGKKLDTISQVIAYKQQREEKEYASSILDSSGRLSVSGIFSQAGSNVKGSMPIQMAGMLLQIAQQGGPVDLASMLISSLVGDKKMGALGDRSINQILGNINEGIGTISDKILSKIINNQKFKDIFGDVTKNKEIGGDYKRSQNEYTRDRAIFDGITRKTIIDVIPGYLREITKALNGKDLRPDKSGELTDKHPDHFRDDALKNFGFGYGDAFKDKAKKAIEEQVKGLIGKEYSSTDIRAAEAVLVGAATTLFFQGGYQSITPELVIANKDKIYKIALRAITNAAGQTRKPSEWFELFEIVLSQVMADKDGWLGASSNAFCTKIQANIRNYHEKATAASQDYISGKQARRLTEDDFVGKMAEYLQEYVGLGSSELSGQGQRDLDKINERIATLKKHKGAKLIGAQAEIEQLEKKKEELQHKSVGMQGDLKREDTSITAKITKAPAETMAHLEDIGLCILDKLHDVIKVQLSDDIPQSFYPKWHNATVATISGGSSKPDTPPDINDPTDPTNQKITDIINGVSENIAQMFSADTLPGKVGQYFQNRAELKGTQGRGQRVMDAVSNGVSAVGQAVKTRGGSIKNAIGNFIEASIDDVKNMGANFIDRKLEEQENRKASISRAGEIRNDLGANQTISDADKVAADTALAMMQSALQDGDGTKEKSRILRQVEKIKNRELKENIRDSINSMMDVQSSKEVSPPKTKLGKILKWALTGLGVVFAPVIKAVKSIGSVFMKGVSIIGGFFKKLANQLVGYGKKFGQASLELGKRGAKAAWGGIKGLGRKVSDFGSSMRDSFRRDKNGESSEEPDYAEKDYGDEANTKQPGMMSRFAERTAGAFSGVSEKIKNSKFMQSDFMKGFSEGFATPESEKEKTPEEKMEDILKSEEPKGVFKTFIDAIHEIRDAWKKKEEPAAGGTLKPGTNAQGTKSGGDNGQVPGQMSFDFGSSVGATGSTTGVTANADGEIPGQLSFGFDGGATGAAGAAGAASGSASGAAGAAAAAGAVGKASGIMNLVGKAVGALGGILKVATIGALAVRVLLKIGMEIINIGIKPLKKAISNFWKALKPVIKALGNAIAEIIEPLAEVLNIVIKLIAPILTYLGKAVGKIVSWAMTFLSPVIEMIGNTVKVVGGVVEVGFGYALKGFAMIGTLLKAIVKVVTLGFGGNGIGALVDAIGGFADTLITMGKQNFNEGISGIVQAGKDLYGAVADTFSGEAFRDKSNRVSFNTDIPDTNHGSAMEGLTGSGDTINYYYNNMYGSGNTTQYSYGGSMNMRERGCGPVALADAYARRTGHGINAASLASAMSSSGNYDQNRGTTVGSYIRTAGSLGIGLTPGGVTTQSLRQASPSNPITVVGSGTGYGTKPGNTHYMNVVGADKNGMAYVSNPLLGGIRKVPTSAVASNSVLGLYGRGDAEDIMSKYHFPEGVSEAFNTLRTIASSLFSMFTGKDAEAAMTENEKSYDSTNKLSQLRRDLGAAKYEELYNGAYEKWKAENPKGTTESDETYNKRWEKAKVDAVLRYSKEAYEERATTAGYNANAIEDADKAANLDQLMKEYMEENDSAADQANDENNKRWSQLISNTSQSEDGSAMSGGYTTNWVTRTSQPENGNPYYNSPEVGGYNTIGYIPSSSMKGLNVLSNCAGYALGRFHEGVGRHPFEWMPRSWGSRNGGSWVETAKKGGLEVDTTGRDPRPGDAISWKKGTDAGHVAIIEEVDGNNIIISHSGLNHFPFKTQKLVQASDGSWPIGWKGYTFSGLVHNPGVQLVRDETTGGTGTLGQNPTEQAIFSYIVNMLGMSKNGAAGMMGCMKYESGMKANNLEDKFQSAWGYPSGYKGDQQYTADVMSGKESESAFVKDHGGGKAGYGLVQFTSSNLKQDLYNRTVKKGFPIDDTSAQLDIVAKQMKSLKPKGSNKTVWDLVKDAATPTKANQQFLWHYEAGTNYNSDEAVARAYPWMGMNGITSRHNAAEQFATLYGDKIQMMDGSNLSGTSATEFAKTAASYGGDGKVVSMISSSGTGDYTLKYIAQNKAGEALFSAIDITNYAGTAVDQMLKSPLYADSSRFTFGGRTYIAYDFQNTPSGQLAKTNVKNSSSNTKIVNGGSTSGGKAARDKGDYVPGSTGTSASTAGTSNTTFTKADFNGFDDYLTYYGTGTYYDTETGKYRYSNENTLLDEWLRLPASGDTATFVPKLNNMSLTDRLYDSLGIETTPTTVNNVTVVRDDGSAKREEMNAALRGTYNVRSESIEAILEEILSELKARKPSGGTPPPRPNQSPESLFDNREVPVQIQRLTTG